MALSKKEQRAAGWKKGSEDTEALVLRLFGPKEGRINWRGPNWWTITLLVTSALLTKVPPTWRPFGLSFLPDLPGLVGWMGAFFIRRVTESYASAIDDFEPRTALEAKRANEQIKLAATLINGSAGAAVTVFALSELVKHNDTDYMQIVFAIGLALWIHTGARSLIGRLKDESIASASTAL